MISYLDNDNSGTISSGDDIIIYLSSFIEIDDATHVRLYSQEADNYNDQNSLLQN
jgi:isopentenyl phosphate kinase